MALSFKNNCLGIFILTEQPKYFWHYQIGFWIFMGLYLFSGGLTHLDFWVALIRNIYYPIAGFISSFVIIMLMRKFKTLGLLHRWFAILGCCVVAAVLCTVAVNPITFMQQGTPMSDMTMRDIIAGYFNYTLIYLLWGVGYLHIDKQVLMVEKPKAHSKKLLLEKNNEIFPVLSDDITHIKAAGDYVEVFTIDDRFLNRATLTSFAREVDHPDFIQSHRSVIVNLNHVKSLSPESKGEYQIILRNNTTIKASRTHAQNVRARLAEI